ncbi:MAG: HPr family phosphocarrier protein [Brotaphodocola sp.]
MHKIWSDGKRDIVVRAKITIKNVSGLHLRPTGVLCNEAVRYTSSVKFQAKNMLVNAKSVLSVLGACVKCGDEIELICEGEDEQEALEGMIRVVESGLGE